MTQTPQHHARAQEDLFGQSHDPRTGSRYRRTAQPDYRPPGTDARAGIEPSETMAKCSATGRSGHAPCHRQSLWRHVRFCHGLAPLGGLAGILLLTGAFMFWQAQTQVEDLANEDSALLSEALPPHALIDKGFQTWLSSGTPAETD